MCNIWILTQNLATIGTQEIAESMAYYRAKQKLGK